MILKGALPPEVLAIIFYHLDDSDLAACSGVNPSWYSATNYELSRRHKLLYRWPYPISKERNGKNLCIAGGAILSREASQLCQGSEHIQVFLDEPCSLGVETLSRIRHPNLKNLTLRNAILTVECVSTLLESNIINLKIYTKRRRDISSKARKLLFQHKELFQELIICHEKPKRTLVGVFPNPSVPRSFRIFSEEMVTLDAAGLREISFESLKTKGLNISNADFLSDEDFLAISELPLRELSISDCKISSDVFVKAFGSGFSCIESLNIMRSPFLQLETIKQISQKTSIKKLCIDLRKIDNVEECLNCLKKLVNLKTLVVHYCNICNFENVIILNKKLKSLKSIIFKNYKFCSKSEITFSLYKEKTELSNKFVHYINERTSEESYFILHQKYKR